MKLGNKITEILKTDVSNFSVKLRFDDGFEGTVYLESVFSLPKNMAADVINSNIFDNCFINAGALAWPNGLELCPDRIRMWMMLVEGSLKESIGSTKEYEPENLHECTHCNTTFKLYHPPCYFCGKDCETWLKINSIDINMCYLCANELKAIEVKIALDKSIPDYAFDWDRTDDRHTYVIKCRIKAMKELINGRVQKFSHKCKE